MRRLCFGFRWTVLLAALSLAAGLVLGTDQSATAHPLGNFTISRFSRIEPAEREVRIHYVVDLAEIPSYQEIRRYDRNGNDMLDGAESAALLEAKIEQSRQGLRLRAGEDALVLEPIGRAISFGSGEVGLTIIRLEFDFRADLPSGLTEVTLTYADDNFRGRLGWREIVVRPGSGVELLDSDAPERSISNELLKYPADFLSNPLDVGSASLRLRLNPTVSSQTPNGQSASVETAIDEVRSGGDEPAAKGRVIELLSGERLTPTVIIIALLAATVWGAGHALTPGHGKAVVAAYLVGARGTPRHALFLGLTVTLTHTAGVFALAVVTLTLSRFILPEDLFPWLSVASGLLVVGIGASLVYRRLAAAREAGHHDHQHHRHDHDHAPDHHGYHHGMLIHTHDGHSHSHLPPGRDGAQVTMRGLLALGISGGLVPCPSALVLLLSAISLGRLELGVLLVLAFSFGLAVVLTGIGLVSIYARRLFHRFSFEPRVPRFLPVASALVVTVAGLAIVLEALRQAGLAGTIP